MDQEWKRLPLLVVFLFLSNAYGFKGAYTNAHQQWGQPSDNTFSPRAVQSSVSEVPVTRTLSEEVGLSSFTNRPLKRFNLLQFVKGHDSSHHESTSHAQSAPSGLVFASLPLPLSEKHADSLTLLQGSGTTITDTASVSTQGTSGQSTSDQSSPSLYMSSSQETSGVESATLPVFSQESIFYSSSSAPGAAYTSQGSPVPLSEGSGQAISPQNESSYSGLSQSQGASSHYTPDYYTKLSSSSVSSQSTSDQSIPSLYSSSSLGSSGSLLEASGSSFQGEVVGLSSSDLSPQFQTSSQLLPSSLGVSSQFTNGQSSPSSFIGSSKSSSDSQSVGPASLLDTRGSLSHSTLSTQTLGSTSTSQGSIGPELSRSSGQLIPTQVGVSYSVSQSLNNSNLYAPGSLMYGKFGPLPIRVSSQSTSTQSSSTTPLTSSHFPVQGGSSSTSSLYLKPQGSLGLYAPASSTKYASVPMPQRAVYSQATSSSGSQFGTPPGFASQGMSSTFGGSLQPQGTTSQFAPGSPSSYPSVSLSSPQGAASQSATVLGSGKQFTSTFTGSSATVPSSRKQFTSSYGTQPGSSLPLTLQGSATLAGSLQPQGTTSQFAPGSPSSYPSVSLSSPQGAASPSAMVLNSRKQFTSTFTGSSSQFAPGSPSSYPSVSLSSPQGPAGPSATVQSSWKQFTSSYGTQPGSSLPLTLQGSVAYGGSLQPQGTTSQFAPGSPSSYPSVSLSSPQGPASQSATVLGSGKQFTSTFTGSSATVPSSRKQFTSSYGTQPGSSLPLTLQGSVAYGGSLQPQGTTSQFAPGSPSSYPSVSLSSPQGPAGPSAMVLGSGKQFTSTFTGSSSQFAPGSPSSYPSVSLSSPQGPASQSATVLGSGKQFTSTFTGSSATVPSSRKQFTSSYGTQPGSSLPLTLQGSVAYGGSLQPQGTTSQFAPGSPSSYPSVSLSSPQGPAGPSAMVLGSGKQFTSTFTGSSSQFAPGSPSSYPSVSLSSPQGPASQSATVLGSGKQFTSTFTGSSATVPSSRKQFTSSYGTQPGSSLPLTLQGSVAYGGSLQPQGTTSQFAPGSPSSYPSVSLSSPQGPAGPSAMVLGSGKQFTSTFTGSSATVPSSRKQFTSSYGTQPGSSLPLTLQGSATFGGSLQPQGTTSQFAPGSPSPYPSVSLSSPQGPASQSAMVLGSGKQFTSTFTGSSSQFAPGSPSSYPSVLSSPQGVASQPSKAFQSYSVSQRWQPSQSIQTSSAAASQGIDLSRSSPMQSRFSSQSSAGGPSSGSGLLVSAPGGGTSYGGSSLNSQSPFNKYNPGSHAYAKFGSSPLAVSSKSTSDQHSSGLYSSGSLQTQGLGVVERPSSQAPFDSPSSNQLSERFVTLQRPTGSNQAPSLGLSAQASSVGMLSAVQQTAQALRESGSDVQLNNQVSSNSQASASTSLQKFTNNYSAQSLKPSELLQYEPGVYGQGTSSTSELLSSYGSTYNLNAPASIPSHSSLSSRYYVKG